MYTAINHIISIYKIYIYKMPSINVTYESQKKFFMAKLLELMTQN